MMICYFQLSTDKNINNMYNIEKVFKLDTSSLCKITIGVKQSVSSTFQLKLLSLSSKGVFTNVQDLQYWY